MDGDRLTQMIWLQRRLQEKSMNVDFHAMSDEQRIAYIKENVLALTDELHELLGEMGWKSWSTSRHINRTAAFAELVDALHFLMNIAIALVPGDAHPGDVAERLHAGYSMKNEINAKRQTEGYDGVSLKCCVCGRALDDPAVACAAGYCAADDPIEA